MESNKTYVLTAGHCIEAKGEEWFAKTPAEAKNKIGTAVEFVAGNGRSGDYGDIAVEQQGFWTEETNPPVFALTAEWKLTGGSTVSYPVKGSRAPQMGFTDCHEGQTTGQSCGQIKAVNISDEYNGLKVTGLVEDREANAEKGDSGGPWLFIESNNEVLMEGIHDASTGGVNVKADFTPLNTALNALKLELLTTRNEVRKLPGPVWRQRPAGTAGNGIEIPRSAPEKFLSKGGTSVLTTGGAVGITITCLEVQNKGTIWNNNLQGQENSKSRCTNAQSQGMEWVVRSQNRSSSVRISIWHGNGMDRQNS